MIKNTIIALLTACLLVTNTGCSTNSKESSENGLWSKKNYQTKLTSWLHPYRIDVQQGNVVTEEMRKDLKVGLNKQQVKHLLGTSVLTESYSKDQWLYVFSDKADGKMKKEEVLVLSFKDDVLNNIQENVIVK